MAEERKKHDEEPAEEAPKGKKGKKEKKEKPPKEKKEKKGKKKDEEEGEEESPKGKKSKPDKPEKEKKEKKSHPVIKTFLSTSLFWLALFSVAAVFTYFNLTPLNPKELVLQLLNPEEDFEVVFESELQTWKDYETELDERSAELEEYSFELDTRSDELDERESQLDDLQTELEEKFPSVFDESAQDSMSLTDILDVAKSVSAMTPKNAADALIGMSQDIAILVLREMKPAQIGAILDQMLADDAASFIEAMASPE